jgi:protein YIPF5/7
MSQYYASQNPPYGAAPPSSAQNLQFYPSSYSPAGVSGHATPSQASYGYGAPGSGPTSGGYGFGGAAAGGVSGRMGEQGGLRTGWLAAFSTEGYDGEPPLLEELGVNFDHIRQKVRLIISPSPQGCDHEMHMLWQSGKVMLTMYCPRPSPS